MNWKTDLKLSDLDANTRIEATCKRCGMTHWQERHALMARRDLAHAYLDEVEKAVKCANRFCQGPVRIALVHDGKTEGFVGGTA